MITEKLSLCGSLARTADPDRFLCALCAPADRREALFTLTALNAELARALVPGASSQVAGPMAGLVRLQWWRDMINGQRHESEHAISAPLMHFIRSGVFAVADLLRLVDAVEEELCGLETVAAWRGCMRGRWGLVQQMMALALGVDDRSALEAAAQAGAGYGAMMIARHLDGLVRRGLCPLPQDMLFEAGTSHDSMRQAGGMVALGQGVQQAVMSFLLHEGRLFMEAARQQLPVLERHQLSAFLPLVLAQRDRKALEAGRIPPPGRGVWDKAAVLYCALAGRL